MRPVRAAHTLALFIRACASTFSLKIDIVDARWHLWFKIIKQEYEIYLYWCIKCKLLKQSYNLESSIFLPVRPTRLTKTILHMRWSPRIPLRTLQALTAFARFSTDSDHKYPRIVGHHATVTVTIQNVGWLSVTIAVAIAQRYDCGRRRCSSRCRSLIIIWYVNLLQFTFRFYSLHSFLLNISIRRFPHVIILDYILQRFPW